MMLYVLRIRKFWPLMRHKIQLALFKGFIPRNKNLTEKSVSPEISCWRKYCVTYLRLDPCTRIIMFYDSHYTSARDDASMYIYCSRKRKSDVVHV